MNELIENIRSYWEELTLGKMLEYLVFFLLLALALGNQLGYHIFQNERPMIWLFVGEPFSIFFTVLLIPLWQWLLWFAVAVGLMFARYMVKTAPPITFFAGYTLLVLVLMLYKPV